MVENRNCPATGLSVSKDNSALVVAYGSTITFWNPNTYLPPLPSALPSSSPHPSLLSPPPSFLHRAELQGSVQLPNCSSSGVTQTAFIEPRQSLEMGGGCGVAYLTAVTDESISVIDVLTLDILWRRKGPSSAFHLFYP
jgi:hypothetical protein